MDRSHLTRGFLVLPTATSETVNSTLKRFTSDREMTSQMGTHASADVFYGVAWDSEELPEKWAKEQQDKWDAEDYSDDPETDDPGERLEKLLKALELDSVLEAWFHGNEYSTGYSVVVRGTRTGVGCGEAMHLDGGATSSPPEFLAGLVALGKLMDHLGRDGAVEGWLVTVSYG